MKQFKFNQKTDNLFKAILSLKDRSEAESFFRDLCTVEEITIMSERWEMARMLDQGITYREIAKKLKTSTTTVARVANWLNSGMGGYRLVIDRLRHHYDSVREKR